MSHTQPVDEGRHFSPWMIVGGIALLAVAAALGLSAAATLLGPAPSLVPNGLAQAVLSDGSVLVLHDLTDGPQLELPLREVSWWERLFGTRRTTERFHASNYGNNSLTLWLARYDAQSGQPLEFDWWSHSIVRTSDGQEIPDQRYALRLTRQTHPHTSTSSSSSARPFSTLKPGSYSHILYASQVSRVRSSDGHVEIDIYHADDGHVATLSAPLPVPATGYPAWTPDALPVTKSDGDLAVTLRSITSQLQLDSSSPGRPPRHDVDVELAVEQEGELTQQWSSRHTSLADALGNTSGTYDCTLPPGEAAWKVRVQLFRSEEAALLQGPLPSDGQSTPADPTTNSVARLVVEDVPLPDHDPATTPNSTLSGETATINGVTVTLLGVGGPGVSEYTLKTARSGRSSYSAGDGIQTEFRPPDATLSIDNNKRHIAFSIAGDTPDQRVVMMLTDQNGVRLKTDHERRMEEARVMTFEADEWVTAVNVYVTVQRARNVEFTVAPPALPR